MCVCLRKVGFNNGFAPNFTNFRYVVTSLDVRFVRPYERSCAGNRLHEKERESKQGDCVRLVLRSAFTDRRCCCRQRRRRRSRSPIDEQSLLNGRAAAAAGAGRPGRWWWWPPLVQQGSVVHGRRGMLHVALKLLQAHGLADVERR